jgi:hypothetical protein
MFKSTPFTSRAPGAIDLNISDPVLLLNEIARRYETTERILMEYVDNALDDAAYLYRDNQGAYPYPIAIDVSLDEARRTMTVRDNCRGMTRETLQRVVQNVGESEKRGVSWVNGRRRRLIGGAGRRDRAPDAERGGAPHSIHRRNAGAA